MHQRIEQAESELRAYLDEGKDLRVQLKDEADDAQQTLDNLSEQWGAGSSELSTKFEQLQAQIGQLDSEINSVAGRVTEAVGKVQSSQLQLQQQLESGKQAATTKFDALHGEMSSLQSTLTEVEAESQTQVVSMGENFNQQQQELQTSLTETLQQVGSSVEKFEDSLTDMHLDVLAGGVENLSTAISQKLENAAKEQIRGALGEATRLLNDVAEKITGSESDTAAVRNAIRPIINEIDDLISPLESLIDAVKAVAGVFSSITSIF